MFSSQKSDLFTMAHELSEKGEAYALVSVLKVIAPAAAKPGDKALITPEGLVHGWVGGGCTHRAVLESARQALLDGRPRVLRVAPGEAGPVREVQDVIEYSSTCASGGTLELFVDPIVPKLGIIIIGDSPTAAALADLAPRIGLPATVIAPAADPARFAQAHTVLTVDEAQAQPQLPTGQWVIVASQGRRDVQALQLSLSIAARQVFLVASSRKAQALKMALLDAGHDREAVEAIVAPAGVSIGAQTPEEIALSVLAAVVQAKRATSAAPAAPVVGRAISRNKAVAVNPAIAADPAAAGVTASCCASKPTAMAPLLKIEE